MLSVRYVMRFVRHKIRCQRRYPRMSGAFFGGYLTWYGSKLSRHRWEYDEYEPGRGRRFESGRGLLVGKAWICRLSGAFAVGGCMRCRFVGRSWAAYVK